MWRHLVVRGQVPVLLDTGFEGDSLFCDLGAIAVDHCHPSLFHPSWSRAAIVRPMILLDTFLAAAREMHPWIA
jgi:hypothetical protein